MVAVVEFVGAMPNGHASLPHGISMWMSLICASVESGRPVIEMTLSPWRRIAGIKLFTSADSPEKLSAIRTSLAETMPRSPCIACTGLRTIERVPVDEKIALIFSAMWRFLPTPETTTIPPSETVSRMSRTALTKDAPIESRVFSRPSISTAKTCFARSIILLSVTV